jgi:cysteine desulfuration protein SufE
MTVPASRQETMRGTLGGIGDLQERLTVAMGWKTGLAALKDEERVDQNLVRGCMSRVWLAASMEEGRCRFRADSDSVMVLGLVRLMCGIYDGATPEEVVGEEPVVMEELGILRNLSPTRQNGLAAVRRRLVLFAAGERG